MLLVHWTSCRAARPPPGVSARAPSAWLRCKDLRRTWACTAAGSWFSRGSVEHWARQAPASMQATGDTPTDWIVTVPGCRTGACLLEYTSSSDPPSPALARKAPLSSRSARTVIVVAIFIYNGCRQGTCPRCSSTQKTLRINLNLHPALPNLAFICFAGKRTGLCAKK